MNIRRLTGLLAWSFLLGVAAAKGQQETLTLPQAVRLALEQSPLTAASRADVSLAEARAALARTALFPRLDFTEDATRGNDPVYAFGTRLRQQRFTQSDFALDALNRPSPLGNFATRFTGTWTVFDWLKTEDQVRSSDFARKGAVAQDGAVQQRVVLDVVQAYQSVLYAQKQSELADHECDTAQALLDTVQTRVRAGLAVESDLMAAQVNLAQRRQDRIAAEGDLDTAWSELETAIGHPLVPRPALQPIVPRHFPAGVLADEIASGLKARPDLRALDEGLSAQHAAVKAAKASFAPEIKTYGTWEMDRPSFAGPGGNNWVVGVRMDLDILPLAKHADLAEQVALQRKAQANLQAAEQQLRLAISRAHSQQQTAARSLETAQAALEQAAEALRITRNRYEAGLATITDLLRAEDAQRQNQNQYWFAVYNNAMAHARLLYATGSLTPGSTEDLQ